MRLDRAARVRASGQPTSLGAAGSFGVLSINGGNLILNSSHLVGNVGFGPNGTSVLQKTDVTGTFTADPSAQVDLSNAGKDFLASGGVTSQSLSQAEADANTASASYAALAPTQSFGRGGIRTLTQCQVTSSPSSGLPASAREASSICRLRTTSRRASRRAAVPQGARTPPPDPQFPTSRGGTRQTRF